MTVRFRHDHACCGRAHGVGHEQSHEGGGAGSAGRPFAFGSSPRHFERDRPFAIEHIALDLALDFPKKSISGSAALTLRRVDPDATRVELDAVAFTIAAVTIDEKPAKYTYDGRLLVVDVPQRPRARYARRPLRGHAAQGALLPRARRARPGAPAPGLDAVPGRGRAPHLPVPRQAARQDDDRGAHPRADRLLRALERRARRHGAERDGDAPRRSTGG